VKKIGIIPLGIALFTMFFGAGNIVYPLILGRETAGNIIPGLIGFIITGVAVPIIGFLATCLYEGNYEKFFQSIGKIPARVVIILSMIIIGILASARCIIVSYASIQQYIPWCSLFTYSLIVGALIFILPTSRNHSIDFFRSFSVLARLENYQTTIKIFTKSPVFGIGYDNMCVAYQKYIGAQAFSSHACSGSDSSILFVLATTGILGLLVFGLSIFRIAKSLTHNSYFIILSSSFIALLVHSLFSNSMFYPWIMGWMIILLAEVYVEDEGLRRRRNFTLKSLK